MFSGPLNPPAGAAAYNNMNSTSTQQSNSDEPMLPNVTNSSSSPAAADADSSVAPSSVADFPSSSRLPSELFFLICRYIESLGLDQHLLADLWSAGISRSLVPQLIHFPSDSSSSEFSYSSLVRSPQFSHLPPDALSRLVQQILPSASNSILQSGPNAAHRDWRTLSIPLFPRSRNVFLQLNAMKFGAANSLNGGNSNSTISASAEVVSARLRYFRSVLGHLCPVYCLTFDRTGHRLISGSDDRLVKIWNSTNLRLLVTCRGHEGEITDLQVSPDNELIASSSNDRSIRIWNFLGEPVHSIFNQHIGHVMRVRFNPDWRPEKQLLITSSLDGTCRVWDLTNLEGRFHTKIACNGETSKINSEANRQSNTIIMLGNRGQNELIAIDANSDEFPVSSSDIALSNASLESSRLHGGEILCVAFHPNGNEFCLGSNDSFVRRYSIEFSSENSEVKLVESFELLGEIDYLSYSAIGDHILALSDSGEAILFEFDKEISHFAIVARYRIPDQKIVSISFSCDDQFLFAAVSDFSSVAYKRPPSGTAVALRLKRSTEFSSSDNSSQSVAASALHHNPPAVIFRVHSKEISVLARHPSEPGLFLSSGADGKIALLSVSESRDQQNFDAPAFTDSALIGRCLRLFSFVPQAFTDGCWSSDGRFVSISSEAGEIYLFGYGSRLEYLGLNQRADQFFVTDYLELTRDLYGNVIDSAAQLPPLLAPGNATLLNRGAAAYEPQPAPEPRVRPPRILSGAAEIPDFDDPKSFLSASAHQSAIQNRLSRISEFHEFESRRLQNREAGQWTLRNQYENLFSLIGRPGPQSEAANFDPAPHVAILSARAADLSTGFQNKYFDSGDGELAFQVFDRTEAESWKQQIFTSRGPIIEFRSLPIVNNNRSPAKRGNPNARLNRRGRPDVFERPPTEIQSAIARRREQLLNSPPPAEEIDISDVADEDYHFSSSESDHPQQRPARNDRFNARQSRIRAAEENNRRNQRGLKRSRRFELSDSELSDRSTSQSDSEDRLMLDSDSEDSRRRQKSKRARKNKIVPHYEDLADVETEEIPDEAQIRQSEEEMRKAIIEALDSTDENEFVQYENNEILERVLPEYGGVFIPQLGDRIVYSLSAHRECLNESPHLTSGTPLIASDRPIIECAVIDVSFMFTVNAASSRGWFDEDESIKARIKQQRERARSMIKQRIEVPIEPPSEVFMRLKLQPIAAVRPEPVKEEIPDAEEISESKEFEATDSEEINYPQPVDLYSYLNEVQRGNVWKIRLRRLGPAENHSMKIRLPTGRSLRSRADAEANSNSIIHEPAAVAASSAVTSVSAPTTSSSARNRMRLIIASKSANSGSWVVSEAPPEELKEFTVDYHLDTGSADYIIHSARFERSRLVDWRVGHRCRMFYHGENRWYSASIVENKKFAATEMPGRTSRFRPAVNEQKSEFDPFNSIQLRWDPNSNPAEPSTEEGLMQSSSSASAQRETRSKIEENTKSSTNLAWVSPWELETIHDSQSSQPDPFKVLPEGRLIDPLISHASLTPPVLEFLVSLIRDFSLNARFFHYVFPVPIESYPDYPHLVSYPSNLLTIYRRLKNNYYRSVMQILFDILSIEIAARRFNQIRSVIYRESVMLVEELLTLIITKIRIMNSQRLHNGDSISPSDVIIENSDLMNFIRDKINFADSARKLENWENNKNLTNGNESDEDETKPLLQLQNQQNHNSTSQNQNQINRANGQISETQTSDMPPLESGLKSEAITMEE